jgi:hypothetical protein
MARAKEPLKTLSVSVPVRIVAALRATADGEDRSVSFIAARWLKVGMGAVDEPAAATPSAPPPVASGPHCPAAHAMSRNMIGGRIRAAREAGALTYQGHPCNYGHGGIRYASNKSCVACEAATSAGRWQRRRVTAKTRWWRE